MQKSIYFKLFPTYFQDIFCLIILLKKITGLCSIRNGVSFCEMESLYFSFLHLNLIELSKVYPVAFSLLKEILGSLYLQNGV